MDVRLFHKNILQSKIQISGDIDDKALSLKIQNLLSYYCYQAGVHDTI